MLYPRGAGGHITPRPSSETPIRRGAAVVTGAILLTWPAVYNRYPLLYPDSITYIADGRPVARALFLHKFSDYYGMRSLLYSLGIFPFHWNATLWPVIGMQALLAAYILWLVVRSVVTNCAAVRYLLLASLLSLLSSASWYASLVMPDVLGPLLWLSIYLLVFARETLSSAEHAVVAAVACWSVTSHSTHLVLASGICLLLFALWLLRSTPLANRLKAIGEVAFIILVAAAAQIALHSYLYGKPSLSTNSPPFLVARVIADGPGRWYLERNCGQAKFALCKYVENLPDNSDEFLWNPTGIWSTAVREGDESIREEELPFVLAAVRAYPREQLSMSAAHFWQQLAAFELWDLVRNDWVLEAFDRALPGRQTSYLASWQFNDDLPLDFFSAVQFWTVVASLGIIGIGVISPLLRRDQRSRLLGLGAVVFPVLIANAMLTGVLSNVEERYQCRVVWLIPLFAGMIAIYWLDRRQEERAARDGLKPGG